MSLNNGNYGAGQTPGVTDVATTSTEIAPANDSRNWILLTNIGATDVYASFDKSAELQKGILLGANGGSLVLDKNVLTTGPINGITSSGTSKVIYQEAI